jgi:hypothetical protein
MHDVPAAQVHGAVQYLRHVGYAHTIFPEQCPSAPFPHGRTPVKAQQTAAMTMAARRQTTIIDIM